MRRALQAKRDPHVVISNGADGLVWFDRMPPGRRFRRAWRWSTPWVPAIPLVAGCPWSQPGLDAGADPASGHRRRLWR